MKAECLESEIQRDLIELLERKFGETALIIRHNTFKANIDKRWVSSHSYGPGFPDVVMYHKSATVFIEIKSSTGKQSKEQKQFELDCRQRGLWYLLVTSPTECLNKVKEILFRVTGDESFIMLEEFG